MDIGHCVKETGWVERWKGGATLEQRQMKT